MKRGQVHVGTSGWTYNDWSGVFYPEDVKGTGRLEYYATRFDAVEVNSTFYRFPSQAVIESWNRRMPDDFHIVLKGSRRVTHLSKLEDARDVLEAFCDRVAPLRTLRAVLWQFPPRFAKDLDRLEMFLDWLPKGRRQAIEFRHASWWDGQTVALLRRYNVPLVAVSHPQLPPDVLPTSDLLYVRFHGLGEKPYRYNYSKKELEQWAARLDPHLAGRTLYAFFNNDYDAHAPRNAMVLRGLLP